LGIVIQLELTSGYHTAGAHSLFVVEHASVDKNERSISYQYMILKTHFLLSGIYVVRLFFISTEYAELEAGSSFYTTRGR
jgi:hypothetical protein